MDELRYPFESLFDFFVGGFVFQVQALHLTFGLVAILVSFIVCFIKFRNPLVGLVGFYFLAPVYSNPGYSIFGIGFPELLGSFVLLLVLVTKPTALLPRGSFQKNTYLAVFLIVAYTLTLLLLDQNQSGVSFVNRILVFAKPVLLAFLFAAALNLQVVRDEAFFYLVCILVFTEVIAYLYQLFIFIKGVVPYGTFPAAGIDSFVSFGGTSNERGHLAKFFNPLLPIILYYSYLKRSYFILIAFFIVAFFNLSASGYVFLLMELLFVAWFFRSKFLYSFVAWVLLFFILIVLVFFSELFVAIFNKIYNLAILGDESEAGGRSLDTFLMYIESFPFGIGYSGSTYRIAEGFPEINSGLFAFISQLSAIGIFLMVSFLCNIFKVIKSSLSIASDFPQIYFLIVGSLTMPFIFFADLLWFVPTIWLPLIFLISFTKQLNPQTKF